jgi:hypothetical protein
VATIIDNSYSGSVSGRLVIAKASQTISGLTSMDSKIYGTADYTLSVTRGASTGALSYSSLNTGVATIHPTTGLVHIMGAGTTTITVNQAADANYNAAAVTQTLTVNPGYNLFAISAPTDSKTYGQGNYTLALTRGASPGELSYSSSNTGVALIDSSGFVQIVGAGMTTITVNQAHNDNYMDIGSVTQTLTVGKADQTITFGSLAGKKTGDASFPLGATASSGLAVAYESSNLAVATISGNTVTILGAGSTVITASQAGDANYNAATAVTQTLTVTQSGTTFASWSGSPATAVTSDLVYKYAFGAADKNSTAQKMTTTTTATTLSLTAVVRTDDPSHLVITAKSVNSLSGTWSATLPVISVANAADQTLNGAPLGTGLVRKVYSVDRGSDSKRFLKLEAVYTP